MQFASIASGSSGNCLYTGNDDTHLLIDAGISKKRIEEGLNGFGVDPGDIDALLITHEHSDHIKGLGVMARKYHMPIYATRGTIREILKQRTLGEVDPSLFREVRAGESFRIGNLEIHPFSIPHDASDPVSYRVEDGRFKIGTATDLGYYDESILKALQGCDILYVEANHDIRMLETGPYPYQLKVRILGNYGHLSNETSGQMVCRLQHDGLQRVILGHLSKENNFPDLALRAVQYELESDNAGSGQMPEICVAPRDKALNIITLK